ncbi:MAG: hypothetical protein OXF68_11920 [Gammaproteobacteria bacterium]|nr:hypothetical protein [Gammaproteobacteria bacterium]
MTKAPDIAAAMKLSSQHCRVLPCAANRRATVTVPVAAGAHG